MPGEIQWFLHCGLIRNGFSTYARSILLFLLHNSGDHLGSGDGAGSCAISGHNNRKELLDETNAYSSETWSCSSSAILRLMKSWVENRKSRIMIVATRLTPHDSRIKASHRSDWYPRIRSIQTNQTRNGINKRRIKEISRFTSFNTSTIIRVDGSMIQLAWLGCDTF